MREQTCCFTGHREINEKDLAKIQKRTREVIVSLIEKGVVYFGAGGARGYDTLAAETVLKLKNDFPQIKLILVLPCPDHTKGWKEEDISRYNLIKNQADNVVYGWLDKVPNYHAVVRKQPYSINGILNYLRATHVESETQLFDTIEFFYKMCHGYTHGNIGTAKYPLLHYFEISIIMQITVLHSYMMLCEEKGGNQTINGIDVVAKSERDFIPLNEQYQKKSTELFEAHYQRLRY